jgi:hypothetical protein
MALALFHAKGRESVALALTSRQPMQYSRCAGLYVGVPPKGKLLAAPLPIFVKMQKPKATDRFPEWAASIKKSTLYDHHEGKNYC